MGANERARRLTAHGLVEGVMPTTISQNVGAPGSREVPCQGPLFTIACALSQGNPHPPPLRRAYTRAPRFVPGLLPNHAASERNESVSCSSLWGGTLSPCGEDTMCDGRLAPLELLPQAAERSARRRRGASTYKGTESTRGLGHGVALDLATRLGVSSWEKLGAWEILPSQELPWSM